RTQKHSWSARMEPLGEVAHREVPEPPQTTTPMPPASTPSAPLLMPKPWEAERMQYLPPTEQIEQQIVTAKVAWDELRRKDPYGEQVFQAAALRDYNRLTGLLPYAYRRDAIQATRPLGCWCLGFGGWNPHYEREGHLLADPPFCGCAEGLAMAETGAAIPDGGAAARHSGAVRRGWRWQRRSRRSGPPTRPPGSPRSPPRQISRRGRRSTRL